MNHWMCRPDGQCERGRVSACVWSSQQVGSSACHLPYCPSSVGERCETYVCACLYHINHWHNGILEWHGVILNEMPFIKVLQWVWHRLLATLAFPEEGYRVWYITPTPTHTHTHMLLLHTLDTCTPRHTNVCMHTHARKHTHTHLQNG